MGRAPICLTENNAEMRDQGAILSVSFLNAADGTLYTEEPHSVHDYPLPQPVDVPVPPGLQEVFGGFQPTSFWQSTNTTAGFPWTGNTLAAMSAAGAGRSVNGVVAVDVPALASLLALTGPVQVPASNRS